MEDVRKQEREEGTFKRGKLLERFMVKKLFGWMDKRYDVRVTGAQDSKRILS